MPEQFKPGRDRPAKTGGQGQGNVDPYALGTWRRNDNATRGPSGSPSSQMAQNPNANKPVGSGGMAPSNALTGFSNTSGVPANPNMINYHPVTGGPIKDGVPYNETYPGPVYPTGAQRQFSFAYCYDRGDGKFTPLIPADELPPAAGYPVHIGAEGMMVLPVPQAHPPSFYPGRGMGIPMVPRDVVTAFPVYDPLGPKTKEATVQATIDNIVGTNPNGDVVAKVPRRVKVYCDKWVHEGVCSFVQLGCKYKHEMPHDRATQKSLGLNGYPAWYKRAMLVEFKNDDVPLGSYDNILNSHRINGGAPDHIGGVQPPKSNWRGRRPTNQAVSAREQDSDNDNGGETVVFTGRRRETDLGPISPPSRVARASNSNPFGALSGDDEDMDEGEM
ncbi:hypothetical protein PVAG01_03566 [Phlyctema vagabunda]|uniref:C3H1-type domain-containing protein n=1 Tax=Phlyctema vagabunda TaxID=108571 RepID=A0ABR4PLS3_9HELO